MSASRPWPYRAAMRAASSMSANERTTVDQRQRTFVTVDAQIHELLSIPLEEVVLAVVSRDDHFEVRRRTQVTADFQQHDVVEAVIALAARLPQISELRRVFRIGEKAASAGRLRELFEAEAVGEFDLRFAIATVKSVTDARDSPSLLVRAAVGGRFSAVSGRSSRSLRTGFARDQRHRVAALRFRTLPDDFAGNDEVETVLFHESPGARLIDHEDLAVEARIQMRAVSVLRIQDDVFVLLGDVDDVQLDAELLGRPQRVVALRLAVIGDCGSRACVPRRRIP